MPAAQGNAPRLRRLFGLSAEAATSSATNASSIRPIALAGQLCRLSLRRSAKSIAQVLAHRTSIPSREITRDRSETLAMHAKRLCTPAKPVKPSCTKLEISKMLLNTSQHFKLQRFLWPNSPYLNSPHLQWLQFVFSICYSTQLHLI